MNRNTNAFHAGREAKVLEIREMGFEAARQKFNADNPRDQQPSSIEAFHYAKGELEALLENA